MFDQLFPTINPIKSTGKIRCHNSDFRVKECNEVVFTDEGEHLWLYVEKTDSNTAWAATQIASACKVPARQVGYAGKKDRHAITQQWFSVQLPKIKDLAQIQAKLPASMKVLAHHWHQSKLKTGHLSHNRFQLVVRELDGDMDQMIDNINTIKTAGIPNYFGPQRFGHQLNNMRQAEDWFAGKTKVNNKNLRGLLLSTARSHIFNAIVAKRIKDNSWNRPLDGDILQLNKSHSWFPASDATNTEISLRLEAFDIHLTAPLWGEDEVQSTTECATLEQAIADQYPLYQIGLSQHRVKQDRRAMRAVPIDIVYALEGDSLKINFSLMPGCYATSVLREILHVHNHNPAHNSDQSM